tara:strand:- start:23 stop:538 length:516 start_codon:yes stop_codon:yes gene_type:complete
MVLIKKIRGKCPKFGKNNFLAENSSIIGDVIIGNNSSVWYNSVIRGDVSKISIGNNVNIQDGAILHATYNKSIITIGDNVSIGHNCLIHGCYIKSYVLVGMGAIVMDGAVIESQTIVAAGSVVLPNSKLESGNIYAGTPAVLVKKLTKDQKKELISDTAQNYILYSTWFQD